MKYAAGLSDDPDLRQGSRVGTGRFDEKGVDSRVEVFVVHNVVDMPVGIVIEPTSHHRPEIRELVAMWDHGAGTHDHCIVARCPDSCQHQREQRSVEI